MNENKSPNDVLNGSNFQKSDQTGSPHSMSEKPSRVFDPIQGALHNTTIETIGLDGNLNIAFFTPTNLRTIDLKLTDIGRPFLDLASLPCDQHLLTDLRAVQDTGREIRRDVLMANGRWYNQRIYPWLDQEGHINGLIITNLEGTEHSFILGQLFQNFLDGVPDAILVGDRDGRIRFINTEACHLFGYEPMEFIGLHFNDLLPPQLREQHCVHIQNYFANPTTRKMGIGMELPCRTKDGREVQVEISLCPIEINNNVIACAAIRDVTDRKLTEKKLKDAMSKIDQANRSKTRFLTAASHDLRQPLQTVTLLLSILDHKNIEPDSRSFIGQISEILQTISNMLDNFLDINQLEEGNITPKLTDFPIATIQQRLIKEFTPQADNKGLSLRFVFSDAVVRSDPAIIEQILRNLISNALKYTKQGRILVGCRRRGDSLFLQVWDTGIGIPKAQFDLIFEEFHQIEKQNSPPGRGLGIGLAIAKRSAELLGLTINVRSKLHQGSMFEIRLPIGTAPEPQIHASTHAQTAKVPSDISVLLVEDDSAVQHSLDVLLSLDGFKVTAMDGPIEAMAQIRQTKPPPDVIVTDFNLPEGINGIDLIGMIRQHFGIPIPAIVLTGDISAATSDFVTKEGCTLLHKPIHSDELKTAIFSGIKTDDQRLAPHASTSALESAAPPPTVFFIDDDSAIRTAVQQYFESRHWPIYLFPSAEAFLATDLDDGCIVADLVMDGMNGIDLIETLKSRGWQHPIIILTGNSDISMAVKAMRAGAIDLIEKPVCGPDLETAILHALAQSIKQTPPSADQCDLSRKLAILTEREHQVMDCVISGQANKVIAFNLGISQRTVEHHRRKMMSKLGADTLADLIKLAVRAGYR